MSKPAKMKPMYHVGQTVVLVTGPESNRVRTTTRITRMFPDDKSILTGAGWTFTDIGTQLPRRKSTSDYRSIRAQGNFEL